MDQMLDNGHTSFCGCHGKQRTPSWVTIVPAYMTCTRSYPKHCMLSNLHYTFVWIVEIPDVFPVIVFDDVNDCFGVVRPQVEFIAELLSSGFRGDVSRHERHPKGGAVGLERVYRGHRVSGEESEDTIGHQLTNCSWKPSAYMHITRFTQWRKLSNYALVLFCLWL